MKRGIPAVVLLLAMACALRGAYSYYYSQNFASINGAVWTQNGSLAVAGGALWGNGSLISTLNVPDGTSEYEVATTLSLPAGSSVTSDIYLRATSNAWLASPTPQGTGYVVRTAAHAQGLWGACGATITVYKLIFNGVWVTTTQLFSAPAGCISRVRAVYRNGIWLYANDQFIGFIGDTSIASGKAGVGIADGIGGGMASVSLGGIDRVAPGGVTPSSIQTSSSQYRIDMRWQAAADDANGTGVAYYEIARNGAVIGRVTATEFTDATVSPGTTYNYQILTHDFHGNISTTPFSAASAPAGVTPDA
jgi:hypothetical protein